MKPRFEEKPFRLTNTMTGKREEFKPQKPPRVQFYSCGPTVYGPLHIGNARALLVADLLFRWLKHIGYDVNFVRNYTDVDDKIIARGHEEKITAEQVAKKYIEYCEEDIRRLGLQSPTKVVKVTESMPDILALIQDILQRRHAYVVDGEVLYSIDSFPTYGKLSGKNTEDLVAGARVEVDRKKKNPLDFALWKPHKPGEPAWKSSWGEGRPGWHIECSAMIRKEMGETIDLHHGGQDLIFPHHENEIAQTEGATGKPFCAHWVHHAFMTMGNEKMSKSLGNILTIREFIDTYGEELLKFMYVSHHFRSGVEFSKTTLARYLEELERVYLAKAWARSINDGSAGGDEKPAVNSPWTPLLGQANKVFEKMEDEMNADLNTPGALGFLFSFIRDINRTEALAAGKPGATAPKTPDRTQVAAEFLDLLQNKLYPLLNVFGMDPDALFGEISKARKALSEAAAKSGGGLPTEAEIQTLIEERIQARKNKDFKRGDEIRKDLDTRGVQLVDSPQGTTWKYK